MLLFPNGRRPGDLCVERGEHGRGMTAAKRSQGVDFGECSFVGGAQGQDGIDFGFAYEVVRREPVSRVLFEAGAEAGYTLRFDRQARGVAMASELSEKLGHGF